MNVFARNHGPDESFQGERFTQCVASQILAAREGISPDGAAKLLGFPVEVQALLYARHAGQIGRAAVAGQGGSSGEAGAELVSADNRYTGDFIEYLHEKTIYFRLPLREVPANVSIKGQDGAAGAGWVGESKGIPVTSVDTSTVSLTPLKVAAIAVASLEWIRDGSPSGLLLLRDAIVEASAQKIDGTFFSTTAASAGVSPAGILNGVSAIASNGVDAADVREDIADLFAPFIAAKNMGGQVLCMSEGLGLRLALMTNSLSSAAEFPDLNMDGGELKGLKAYTGGNVVDDWFIMLKPSDIWKIGAEGIRVEVSRDASIELESAPTIAGDVPTAASLVSMFQTDSVALKVVQPMNFQKRRSHAAQYIADAQYGESDTVTA